MGYKNKAYQKSLHQQVYDKLTQKLHAGEGTSRQAAKADGTAQDKIFSYASYQSYSKHCNYFTDWVKDKHPEVTSLNQAKQYVKDFLKDRIENGGKSGKQLSAPTIYLERQALSKLYGIKPDDKNFYGDLPTRHRVDITRSRGGTPAHFNESTHRELVNFCKGTGCRRNVLEKLTGRDYASRETVQKFVERLENKGSLSKQEMKILENTKETLERFPNAEHFIIHDRDKGGRSRIAPVIGDHQKEIVDRMKATKPDEKVFGKVSKNAPIHSYRADYANAIYKATARPIEAIPRIADKGGRMIQPDVYACRGDEKGRLLDKEAMKAASLALGHNRIDVIANNYLRD